MKKEFTVHSYMVFCTDIDGFFYQLFAPTILGAENLAKEQRKLGFSVEIIPLDKKGNPEQN